MSEKLKAEITAKSEKSTKKQFLDWLFKNYDFTEIPAEVEASTNVPNTDDFHILDYVPYSANELPFSTLIGKTLVRIEKTDDAILWVTSEGEAYQMYHSQDCCENVSIEDINGDLNDLLGDVILKASEDTDGTPKKNVYEEGTLNEWTYEDESATWTFYNIATLKTWITIRWYGYSNGYYSEGVSFRRIDNIKPENEE